MNWSGNWRLDFVPMSVRTLYGPQWKDIQVLNVFIASLIVANENKTQLLRHSLQENITLSSPRELACERKAAIQRKAISGQTWNSQMWEGTAVLKNRPGRRACWVLSTTQQQLQQSCFWSEAGLCSALTAVHLLVLHPLGCRLAPFGCSRSCTCTTMLCHQQHATLSLLQPRGVKDHRESVIFSNSLCTLKASVNKENSPTWEEQSTQAGARQRTVKGRHYVPTCSWQSLVSPRDLTHSSLNASECSLNLLLYFF